MNYEEYKEMLKGNGWGSVARYMGTGTESGCDMKHENCDYTLTIHVDDNGNITAEACVMLPGFMNPVTTGKFGSPWSNKAFHTQAQRLSKIKRMIGDSLIA